MTAALAPLLLALGPGAPAPAEAVVLRRCEVAFERSALLGPAVAGVLGECALKPGAAVKAGQVVARLVDRDAKAERDLRAAEARSVVEVHLAEAHLQQAQAKLRRAQALGRQALVSAEETEVLSTDLKARALELEAARHRKDLAALREKQAEAAVRDRELVSPIDGTVQALTRAPGEPVAAGDPVARVIDDRTLRVTGHLDIADAWGVRPGRRVRIVPEVAGADLDVEREAFEGRVTFVDPEVDRELRTVKVVAEVANRDGLLRAGIEARMEILPESAENPPPAAPPAS